MALLQISDPHGARRPIGIDLGTTNSLVAYVTPTGEPVAVRDCDDDPLVPSVVHFVDDGRVLVGKDALALAEQFPEDTILSVKRFMGRGGDDAETRRLGPYRFSTETGTVVRFSVRGAGATRREVTPVEVSAHILAFLREQAEDAVGNVGGVVITVPAYFDDAQRQATKDAGKLAGLEVLRLLNEPTAAALAYGLDQKQNGTFAVYDLGGGTFDVTVLSLEDGVFQVRSTGGDSQLGGDDIDRGLAEIMLREIGQAHTPALVRRVLLAARAIKHGLSERDEVEAELALPDGTTFTRLTTRAELEAIVAPLAARTGQAVRRALRDAGRTAAEIDGVILVGGATRVPAIRAYVAGLFGKQPLADIDPDQVVALGAAVQAEQLAGEGRSEEVLLLDVLPLSLGVETMGGVVERILPRNTPIPAAHAQEFTTYADHQTGFELHVVQGERELAADCRSLARFTLRGIPPMPAGMARLRVTFRVDADGLLTVEAEETSTGTHQEVEVRPSYGLSDEEVERMLLDAYEHGEDDVKARRLREEQVEGARILAALTQAIDADGEALLTDEEERADVEGAMRRLQRALEGDDHDEIRRRVEDLDHASKAFAGRRMDRSIERALAGRSARDLENETQHARGIEPHLGSEIEPERG